MTGITAFQLDTRRYGECLEALTGLSALQIIGLQLRRDTLCRASATGTGRILLVRLLNSSNTCYINASVRAWLFAVSHLSVADVLKYGAQEQAWRDVYHTRRPTHVHALCSWKSLLRNWAYLHMQHDACEFLEHILGAGRPQVLQGTLEVTHSKRR